MKKILLPLILFFVTATLAYGQSSEATITGTVLNQNGESIPNASVALYDSTGSETMGGTVTDPDGEFELSIEPGSYLLRISYVSYGGYEEELELSDGEDVDLGTIELEPGTQELAEVEVRAERSSMEMSFDSRRFNVGQDITSMGGSALDVLDNVPSISTDFEGNVSLRGNEGVQILINGRPSSLVANGTEALSTIPANLIKDVEIITNPSSRYSAEGTAGIINIILRDNADLGFNGTVTGSTGYPHNHEVGTNFNYNVNNINWFFGTSLGYDSRPRSGDRYQLFSSADTSYIYDQTSESEDYELEGDLRFGADVYLPADQLLTLSTRMDLEGGGDEEEVRYTDYVIDQELEQRLQEEGPNQQIYPDALLQQVMREDIEEKRERDLDVSLQYENKFNENDDHRLTADLDFDIRRERENSDLVERLMEGSGEPLDERTSSKDRSRDFRFDVDYEQPLGESGRFEAGFRSNHDWMENDYLVEREVDGNWVELAEFNDSFSYYENVNSIYSTLAGGFGRFTFQGGVRAEQTIIRTELLETGEGSDQNYLNLFPSAFLSYQFNEQNSVQVSYSRRLRRPWSRMLLPFSNYSDSRNRYSGNPELMPEFGNSYEAGYLRYWQGGSLLTNLYYRYRTDVFERITIDEGNGVRRRLPVNLATEQAWGVEFTADQELFSGLQLMANLNLYESESEGTYQDQVLRSDGGALFGRLRARWRFLEGWNFQTSMMYRGPRETAQGRENGSSFMSTALAKEFLDRRATISLNVWDVFNARQHDETINDANSFSNTNFQWSSRSFRLNFRYNFSSNNPAAGNQGRGRGGPRR